MSSFHWFVETYLRFIDNMLTTFTQNVSSDSAKAFGLFVSVAAVLVPIGLLFFLCLKAMHYRWGRAPKVQPQATNQNQNQLMAVPNEDFKEAFKAAVKDGVKETLKEMLEKNTKSNPLAQRVCLLENGPFEQSN
jgi:flagellar biosynthesis/type III secretory pathway M-ring protein FliF/YscJ